jgi:hypothetical protein
MKRTKLTLYNTPSGKARAVQIKFEKIGNWDTTVAKLVKLDKNLKSSLQWGERKVGEKLVNIVKNHLRNQDLGWDGLATSTLWKKKGDARVLIDTETYLNSIKTWQSNGTRFIGVPKDITNPENGEEVWRIAQIHEFKSYHGGPFRALWGPSMEEIGGNKGVRDIIFDVLYKKMKKLGYPVTRL